MRAVCTAAQMRRAEAGAPVPETVLMQRAATALAGVCAEWLRASRGRVTGARVVALVGAGNNGGDALWALARLASRGAGAWALGDPARMHAQGAAALRAAGGRFVPATSAAAIRVCQEADLALDGIVGIGGQGAVRGPFVGLISALSEAGVQTIAVDIPSGVSADTGEVPGAAVRAAVTVTFGFRKVGLVVHPGRAHAGVVTVADIGLPEGDLDVAAWELDLSEVLAPAISPEAHKYSRGLVEVIASSAAFPGAAHLAVAGALGSGAGMVALCGGPGADPGAVVARFPQVVLAADPGYVKADVRVVGPGLGDGSAQTDIVHSVLADPAPLVVDASALNVLGQVEGRAALGRRRELGWVTVVTPHEGEFARLGCDLSGGRLAAARRAADDIGAVVVLKGPGTIVAAPSGMCFVDPYGGPELASAGSGDLLAGLCGGILATAAAARTRAGDQLGADEAARCAAVAVGRHGLAGRLAAAESSAVTALDVAAQLGRVGH